jgi:hypothetical protein
VFRNLAKPIVITAVTVETRASAKDSDPKSCPDLDVDVSTIGQRSFTGLAIIQFWTYTSTELDKRGVVLITRHETVAGAAQDDRIVHATIRSFFKLAAAWGLNEREQIQLLDDVGRSTLYGWRRVPPDRVSPDLMRRLSYLLGIHALLRQLFPATPMTQMAARLRRPHPVWFTGGRSLLAFMLDGGAVAMHQVRSYLVSENGSEVGTPPADATAWAGTAPLDV